ncbi:hypothetical protein EDD16DRAFT_1637944 [Pisolithus croceorrhizus]|nr:hypothetical protein EDD16DRAFT_1637944 [Pisolithus croceorrhizus]
MAPSAISILTNGSSGPAGELAWNGGDRHSPVRDCGEPPCRSSRSMSPRQDDRGHGEGGHKPGNNLHVSGLSHRVNTRNLEQVFVKIGCVKKAFVMYDPHTHSRGFG